MEAAKKWFLPADALNDLTAVKARDLIVRCFLEAQKETIVAAGHNLGQQPTGEDLQNSVVGAVRLAFREIHGDYDEPTKNTLMQVVGVLARKSSTWGTPPDIIAHHKTQIERVLAALR